MVIRTITCHDVYNAGASLQAYALVSYLSSLGHDARIIDYKPDYLNKHYSITAVGNTYYNRPVLKQLYLLAKLPSRLVARNSRRRKNFDSFRDAYLPLTGHYESYKALCSNPPHADLFLAGSDQIWNTSFENGKDPAFYLMFAPKGSVRASYAASFAVDRVDKAWSTQQKSWIEKLDGVSVRELTGLHILEQFGVTGGQTVVDPVFLLDADDWNRLAVGSLPKDPYVLVYDFDGNSTMCQVAKELAEMFGLCIVSLFPCGYEDVCREDAGPREFLSLINGAEYILSNSFHATAFSLIFQRPFLTFDRKEKLNSRIHDLLTMVGLENRIHAYDPINWGTVQEKLNEQISSSRAYLDWVISLAEKRGGN